MAVKVKIQILPNVRMRLLKEVDSMLLHSCHLWWLFSMLLGKVKNWFLPIFNMDINYHGFILTVVGFYNDLLMRWFHESHFHESLIFYSGLMYGSFHIRSVEIGVEYWNCCRILNLCFLFYCQLKKMRSK